VTAGSLTNVGYDSLHESLTHAGAPITLAELHGGISGALCAGGPAAAARWLDELFAEPETLQDRGALDRQLYALVDASWRALNDGELAFEPLLPSDALGLNAPDIVQPRGAGPQPGAPPAIEEILADFGEIGRAGVTEEDAADRDKADFALAELHEYVRVSVQIVFDELALHRSGATREVH
jgi:uncharacterized protein YgfB (UPF0149 family)